MEFYRNKLKAIRKYKKITMEELADKMGLNRCTIRAWEDGTRVPLEAKIRMMARALNIATNEISDIEPDKIISNTDNFSSAVAIINNSSSEIELHQKNIDSIYSGISQLNKKILDLKLINFSLLSSIPSLCYIKNTDLRYIVVNEPFLENLSLNKNYDVRHKTDFDFFPKAEAIKNDKEDREVIITGKKVLNKEAFIPGSRKRKWGLITKTPVFDSNGKIQGIVGSIVDITHRKSSEEELHRSETRLREAQHIANIGCWELNFLTNEIECSEEVYNIFKISKDKNNLTYEYLLGIVHPEERDIADKAYANSVKNKTPHDLSHRLKFTDGKVKFVNQRCETFYNEAGKPIRSVGTVQDITERKTAEIALAQSESNFRTFIEMLDDIVLISNDEGEIIYSNPSASISLGYSPEEFKKMQILDLHPSNLQKEAQLIVADMLAGKRKSCPLPLLDKNKCAVPVETRVSFGKWNGNDCLFGISKVIPA